MTENGRLQHLEHPVRGDIRLVAPPVTTDEPAPNQAAPALGEHTDALLGEIGYHPGRSSVCAPSGSSESGDLNLTRPVA